MPERRASSFTNSLILTKARFQPRLSVHTFSRQNLYSRHAAGRATSQAMKDVRSLQVNAANRSCGSSYRRVRAVQGSWGGRCHRAWGIHPKPGIRPKEWHVAGSVQVEIRAGEDNCPRPKWIPIRNVGQELPAAHWAPMSATRGLQLMAGKGKRVPRSAGHRTEHPDRTDQAGNTRVYAPYHPRFGPSLEDPRATTLVTRSLPQGPARTAQELVPSVGRGH